MGALRVSLSSTLPSLLPLAISPSHNDNLQTCQLLVPFTFMSVPLDRATSESVKAIIRTLSSKYMSVSRLSFLLPFQCLPG